MGKTVSLLLALCVLAAFGMSPAQAEKQKMKSNIQQKADETAKNTAQSMKGRTVPQSGNNATAGMPNAGRKKR